MRRRKIRRLCARDLNSVGNRFLRGRGVSERSRKKKVQLLGCNPGLFVRQLKEERSSSEVEWRGGVNVDQTVG